MAEKIWKLTRVLNCEHAGYEVALETELVYPDERLPDPPRVIFHGCSATQDLRLADTLYCPHAAGQCPAGCWLMNPQGSGH
jgi:hypothetical protein